MEKADEATANQKNGANLSYSSSSTAELSYFLLRVSSNVCATNRNPGEGFFSVLYWGMAIVQ